MESKFSYALELVNWIRDQSLLTVRINTRTRVKTIGLGPRWDWVTEGPQAPRSIVTDHYLLDQCFQALSIYRSWKWEDNVAWLVLLIINWKLKGVQILPMAFPWTLPMTCKGRDLEFARLGVRARKPAGLIWIVAHWSWVRCAAALGIIPGETYREPL